MGVGKCVTKENPKSDLDLDLEFVKFVNRLKLVIVKRRGMQVQAKSLKVCGSRSLEWFTSFSGFHCPQ